MPPFPRESPEAIPGEMGASGGRWFGSCHLYPRTGTSPTEDLRVKLWRLPTYRAGRSLSRSGDSFSFVTEPGLSHRQLTKEIKSARDLKSIHASTKMLDQSTA